MNIDDIDLSALTDVGDTLELDDGRRLRLVVEHDEHTRINDFDCYGRTDEYSYGYTWPEGHRARPDDFDGNAEKLSYDRNTWMWWQPPSDVSRGSDEFRALRSHVIDLLERGFDRIGLELLGDNDFYGRPIVLDATWLGGCDSTDVTDYLPDLLVDLLGGDS